MRIMIKTLALSLSLMLGTAAAARAEKPIAAKVSKAKVDWKQIEQHLRDHQKYPATKAELVVTCNNLMDFADADKKWFAASLPEGSYKSADDVVKALKAAK